MSCKSFPVSNGGTLGTRLIYHARLQELNTSDSPAMYVVLNDEILGKAFAHILPLVCCTLFLYSLHVHTPGSTENDQRSHRNHVYLESNNFPLSEPGIDPLF